MGRMNLLNNIVNPANNQVEGFCVVKSVAIKSNVKGSDYLDMILADAGGEISAKLWDYSIEQHGVYEPDSIIPVYTQGKPGGAAALSRGAQASPRHAGRPALPYPYHAQGCRGCLRRIQKALPGP